jgi:hypothetical protein
MKDKRALSKRRRQHLPKSGEICSFIITPQGGQPVKVIIKIPRTTGEFFGMCTYLGNHGLPVKPALDRTGIKPEIFREVEDIIKGKPRKIIEYALKRCKAIRI